MPSTTSGTTASGSVSTGRVTSSVAPASTRSLLAVPAPSTLHQAARDQVGGAGAREPEHLGDRGVHPLAGQPVRHREGAVVCARAAMRSRVRGSSVRRATRDPSSRIPRKACTRISAAATLMHMSATLKIGQCGSIRKSTTWPRSGPGCAEQPVGEVAGDAGEQQPEGDRPQVLRSRRLSHSTTSTADDRQAREHLGVAGAGAERGAGVAGQVQHQQVADQLLVRLAGEPVDGQPLGDLVDGVAAGRRRRPAGPEPGRGTERTVVSFRLESS